MSSPVPVRRLLAPSSRSPRLARTAALVAAALSAASIQAQTISWSKTAGGTFSTGTNWNGSVAPTSTQTAAFGLAATYPVVFPTSPVTANLTVSAGNVTFQTNGTAQTYATGNLSLDTGATLTLSGTAAPLLLDLTSGLVNGGATMVINQGNKVTSSSYFDISSSTSGSVTVDGAGSSLTVNVPGQSYLGVGTGTGTLIVRNSATASFTHGLIIGRGTGTGNLIVASGATVSLGTTSLGAGGGTGIIFLSGGTLATTGPLDIGSASASTASGIMMTGGTFNAAAPVNLLPTANVDLTGGTVNASADFNVAGGTLTLNGGSLNLSPGRTLSMTAGGRTFAAGYQAAPGTNLTVAGTGSAFSTINNGVLSLPATTTTSVSAGGTLTVSQFRLGVGGGGPAAVATVDGAGCLLYGGVAVIGADAPGSLTFTNSANGSFDSLLIGGTAGAIAGTTSTLAVHSSSLIGVGALNVGATGPGNAAVTLSTGGQVYQSGAWPLTIGQSAGNTASITTASSAFFSTSSGPLTVNPTGSILAAGGSFSANGPTHIAGGSVTVSGGSFLAGDHVTLTGGTLTRTAGTFSLAAGKNLTASAGANVTLAGGHSFNGGNTLTFQSGATLSVTGGALVLAGNPSGGATYLNVTGPGSAANLAGLSLGAGGHLTQVNVTNLASLSAQPLGTTLYPSATITILDGYASLGPLTENGGVIQFNSGSLSYGGNLSVGTGGLLGADLTLASNRSLSLTGTTTVHPFHSLTLAGGTLNTGALANNGTFVFSSGTLGITGPAGLTLGSGGMLGPSFSLTQTRTLNVTNATTIAAGAHLSVDGGSFSSGPFTNGGNLTLNAGTATLTGSSTNQAGAEINLAPLATLGGTGTLTNSGLIRGDGLVTKPVANAATGELRAESGKRLKFSSTNSPSAGRISLLGGTAEFSQPLTNAPTGVIAGRGALITPALTNQGQLQLSGGATDIFGAVTSSNGSKILVTGGATATFYSPVTLSFGSELRVAANSAAVFLAPLTGMGLLTGPGDKYFESGPSAPAFLATSGSTTVQAPASLTTGYLAESSLTSFGPTTLLPNSPQSTIGTLDLSTTGTLDLANNTLLLTATPNTIVRQYLFSGQLTSTTPDPADTRSIGYLTTPAGLLVKLTITGDANLDGGLDADDFALLDRGALTGGAFWWQGDFNYDGHVTSADYLLIDRTLLLSQAPGAAAGLLASRESQFGAGYVNELLAAVPEPGLSFVVCPLSALLVGGRGRRTRYQRERRQLLLLS